MTKIIQFPVRNPPRLFFYKKWLTIIHTLVWDIFKPIKGKRKLQGVLQSQAAAHPRHEEEEDTDKTKQTQIKQTHEKRTKISSLFPKRGYRKAKRTEKYKNTITQGKT